MSHDDKLHDTIHFFEQQYIRVGPIRSDGLILDIGGGGEGIIGRLMGERVIAIDPSSQELLEAPPGPLKVVMDATNIQFLDESFPVVTAFFALMYIPIEDHPKVFGEVHRVLKPGGEFLIWDGILPPRQSQRKDFAAFQLRIALPGEQIETAYGVRWPSKTLDIEYYLSLATDVGFELMENELFNIIFRLRMIKA